MRAVEVARAAREVSLTSDEVRGGVRALARALAPRVGYALAIDAARNMGGAIRAFLEVGEEEPVASTIRESAKGRRENWPRTAWGKLSDAELDALAAEGAVAWETGVRGGRAGNPCIVRGHETITGVRDDGTLGSVCRTCDEDERAALRGALR